MALSLLTRDECAELLRLRSLSPGRYHESRGGELGCAWRLPVAGWVIYVERALGVSMERLREIVEAP